jgi:hypothetical protein
VTGWVEALPELVTAAVLLFAPGSLLLLAAGAPWRKSVLFAPATSTGAVALLAILADFAGVRFGRPLVVVATVAASLLIAALRLGVHRFLPSASATPVRSSGRRPGWPARSDYAFAGALAIPVLVLGWRLGSALGGPDRISQTYDNVFHLNATRYIIDSGMGSSLRLSGFGSGPGGFYPAAWHDLAALTAFRGDVVVATQALALVVAAIVWPASMLMLVRRLSGRRWGVLYATAAVLAGLGTFPARMLDFGVLYAFMLGIALMPAVITVALIALGPRQERGDLHGFALLVMGGAGLLGLGLAHTGALLAFPLILSPLVAVRLAELIGARWRAGYRVSTAVLSIAGLLVALECLRVLNRSQAIAALRAQDWPARSTPSQAVGAWALSAPHNTGIPWVFAALVLVGIGVALTTRHLRWLVAAHVLLGVPYVFAQGVDSNLSQLISGFWYNDAVRIGGLYPLTAVPLAAVGLAWLASRIWRVAVPLAARSPRLPAGRLFPAAVGLVTVGLLVTTMDASSKTNYAWLASTYSVPQSSAPGTLLSRNEWTLLRRLPTLVPPGVRIADNPWDGSALAYAISGRPVMIAQLGGLPTGDAKIVAEGLAHATEEPAVCGALGRLHIRYALDFGPPLTRDNRYLAYPGLQGLADSPAVRLVDHVGRARLYEVTACGDLG